MGFFFCSSCCNPWGRRYWRKGCRAVNITCPTVEKCWGFWAKWKCFFSSVDLPVSNTGTALCTPTRCTSTSVQQLHCSQNIRSLKKSNISLSLSTCPAPNILFTIFSLCKYGTDTSTCVINYSGSLYYPRHHFSECTGCRKLKWSLPAFLACHQNKSLECAESSVGSYGITVQLSISQVSKIIFPSLDLAFFFILAFI